MNGPARPSHRTPIASRAHCRTMASSRRCNRSRRRRSHTTTSRPLRASALPLPAGTVGVARSVARPGRNVVFGLWLLLTSPRFAAPASRLPKTAAAPIACASTKTASSPPSPPKPRPLCLLTPSGAASASLRPCTAPMASPCLLPVMQTPMASRRARTRRTRRTRSNRSICQALPQVRTQLI